MPTDRARRRSLLNSAAARQEGREGQRGALQCCRGLPYSNAPFPMRMMCVADSKQGCCSTLGSEGSASTMFNLRKDIWQSPTNAGRRCRGTGKPKPAASGFIAAPMQYLQAWGTYRYLPSQTCCSMLRAALESLAMTWISSNSVGGRARLVGGRGVGDSSVANSKGGI